MNEETIKGLEVLMSHNKALIHALATAVNFMDGETEELTARMAIRDAMVFIQKTSAEQATVFLGMRKKELLDDLIHKFETMDTPEEDKK